MIGEDDTLPALRQDLRILPAGRLASGAPGWVIFDPVMHRYFQLSQGMVELLGAWSAGTVTDLLKRIRTRFGRVATSDEVLALRHFLMAHELLEIGHSQTLTERSRARKHHWLHDLVHNYLFFRIPLVRPQAFLERTQVVGDVLFSKASLTGFALMGLIGLMLAARQWETFVATGLSLMDWEGAFIIAACVPFLRPRMNWVTLTWRRASRCGCRPWGWPSWCSRRSSTPT